MIDAVNDKAGGIASYLNINLTAGSIEVGGITYSPALQRKPPADTEAMFLMMQRAFDEHGLGYPVTSGNAMRRTLRRRLRRRPAPRR